VEENAHRVQFLHQDLNHGLILRHGVERPLLDKQVRQTPVLPPLLIRRLLVRLNDLCQWHPLLQNLHLHQREIVIVHRNVEDMGLIVVVLTGVITMTEALNLLLVVGKDGATMTMTMEKGQDDTTTKDTSNNY